MNFLYSYLPCTSRSWGVSRQRVVCCYWPQRLATALKAFPILWLARAVTLAQLSDRAANQSDSDICSEPRGEPRRLRLSICAHCNLAAPRSRQENPRPLLAAYGRDRIALCVHFLESFFVACRSPRRHDSRVSAPVGRVGRVGPGRVVGVFSGAVWRRRWAPPSHKK